jgi:lysozyme
LALTDFSPPNQDKAAIYLIQRRGALTDVKAGNFTKAVEKCKNVWASLPGSPYGQNPKRYAEAVSYYKQAGGTFVA